MKIALWIVQALLAVAFLGAGGLKAFTPIEGLAQQMAWVVDVSTQGIRFIGFAELAGALRLILPALTRILPWLTPLAAAGLVIDMLAATVFHLTRGEFGNIVPTLILLVLAAFVAYGRWKLVPIASR